jgi:hypothetical protein
MGIELPAELTGVAARAGVSWPQADEDKMRACAQAWRQAGTQVSRLAGDADRVAHSALAAIVGKAGDAATRHWNGFTDPDSGHFTAAIRACTKAADRLEHAAAQVAEAKTKIIRRLVSLARTEDAAHAAGSAGHSGALAGLTTALHSAKADLAGVAQDLTQLMGTDDGGLVHSTNLANSANPSGQPDSLALLTDSVTSTGDGTSTGGGDGTLSQDAALLNGLMSGTTDPSALLGDPNPGNPTGPDPTGAGQPALNLSGIAPAGVDLTGGGQGTPTPLPGSAGPGGADGSGGSGLGLGPLGPAGPPPAPVDAAAPAQYTPTASAPPPDVQRRQPVPAPTAGSPPPPGPAPAPPPVQLGQVSTSSAGVVDVPAPVATPVAGPGASTGAPSLGSPVGPPAGFSAPAPVLGSPGTAAPGQWPVPVQGPAQGPAPGPAAGPTQGPGAGPTQGPAAGTGPSPGQGPTSGPTQGPVQPPTGRAVPTSGPGQVPVPPGSSEPGGAAAAGMLAMRGPSGRTGSGNAAGPPASGAAGNLAGPAGPVGSAQRTGLPRRIQPTPVAAFLLYMFPIGHLPVATDQPRRQLPPPSGDADFAAGLRFPPHDHPQSVLIDDADALANPIRVAPSAGRGADDPEVRVLAVGYDPLGGPETSEFEWDRRFVVRQADEETGAAAEYAWPPAELFPEGGREPGAYVVLEPGVVLDRFGTPEGRVFGADHTPFDHRALPPDQLAAGYHRYDVLRPLPVWQAVSAEWFGQPGGGTKIRTVYPAADLVALGYLRELG